MRTIILGLSCLLISACTQQDETAAQHPQQQSRFQLVTSADGRVLRLDGENGNVHLVTGDYLMHLSEGAPALVVGGYYRMADETGDERFLKYLGNGNFERSAYAIVDYPQGPELINE